MYEISKLFLVFALHRSGSSAVAGVLYHMGIPMGDNLLGPNPTNPKGHFENLDFVALNDKILGSVGAAWDRPPSRDRIMASKLPENEVYSTLLKQAKPVYGLKDPRMVITFDYLKPFLEVLNNITYVFVWRPLDESIQSLAHRSNSDYATAQTILGPYNANLNVHREQLEKENKDIVDIRFADLLENPEDFVKKINQRLNYNINYDKIKEFLDKDLKHF
ncbi:sulfotransferase family protein [Paenibacillus enshidis]|uniref:Sulfotransferase family protein n=1 Tax=Paenibacillus enshidis TaxID=1458439 RepID=A0ABV5AW32_9BACL